MPLLAQLLAPLALMLAPSLSAPVQMSDPARGLGSAQDAVADSADEDEWSLALRIEGPPLLPSGQGVTGVHDPETWHQVRIEQHLTIRIYPGQMPRGANFGPPPSEPTPHSRKRHALHCIAMAALGGVRLSAPNQLTLILRDDRMVVATLPKVCSTSAFYSGFYVEPTPDGMLCARRDVIHSRAGSNCSISRLAMRDGGN